MDRKDRIIQILRENSPFLKREFGVNRIGIFGSTSKGIDNEESDIDLVIEFSKPIGFRFVEMAEYLESYLESSVDILTPAGLDNIRVSEVAQDIQETLEYV